MSNVHKHIEFKLTAEENKNVSYLDIFIFWNITKNHLIFWKMIRGILLTTPTEDAGETWALQYNGMPL
jgi:hypothetical protein